ncbi:hypothetical protein LWI29_031882 [Acer saccharum]|uniref:Homeobox domain-containing protein n=1 Tax=Acer saccharum TaxID=4024 RepID=A0AA39T6V2_ACESA|nr:hypothetical protein LWI29_031882 [Acer saccharum]
MEDHQSQDPNSPSNGSEQRSSEPVRSRWTPKPEQIVILESIFNSGMVNPPKDETVRIRKLLEKFGSVGDANVFYWFQNRRSRSRRRQRQLQQASLAGEQHGQASSNMGAIQYGNNSTASCAAAMGFTATSPAAYASNINPTNNNFLAGSSSSRVENLYSMSGQMGFQGIEHSQTSNLHYQPGLITVFINGVATEVARGPLDMKAVFGQDVILVHSSGVPVPTNEFGILIQSLQHGESYFLIGVGLICRWWGCGGRVGVGVDFLRWCG